MASSLEKSILATVAYYDVLGIALTGFEIWQYLIRYQESGVRNQARIKLSEIIQALHQSKFLAQTLSQDQGFCFLKGRQKLAGKRIQFMKETDQKLKRAKKTLAWLQVLPYIRAIFISGSVAVGHPKPKSDIDVLIVTKSGRIWTARALVTLFLMLLGRRRFQENTEDKICLNHFITDKSLEVAFPSLYNAQTYAHLMPFLLKNQDLHKRFYQENRWMGKYLVNFSLGLCADLPAIKPSEFLSRISRILERLLDGFLGNFWESWLKSWQKRRITKDPRSWQQGGRVVAQDEQLEFHPASKERKVLQAYNQKIIKLGFPQLCQEKDSGLL